MSLIHKNMTEAQRAANKANGSKSQGPSTPQGAQRMRMSKIKHGYYASFFEETLAALGEDPGEFAQLRQDLLNYWKPADAFRRLLVERLARLMWQLQRGECQQETALARRLRGLESEEAKRDGVLEAQSRLLQSLRSALEGVRGGDFSGVEPALALWRSAHPRAAQRRDTMYEGCLELLADSPTPQDRESALEELRRLLTLEIDELQRPYAAKKQEQAAQEAAGWNPELKRAWEGMERKVETLSRQMVRTLKLLQELKALDEAAKDLQRDAGHADGEKARRTQKNSQNESTSHQVEENKG